LSLIALLPMPLAFYAYSGAVKYGQQIGSAPQYLGANVAVAIITPLLLGISLVLGG
jgi:1,4-dihydroxy-2-naphthoate octaprenyltransferase